MTDLKGSFGVFDVPIDLPTDYQEHVCINAAARHQRLPADILWAIRMQEGGQRGLISRNKDGSVDVGVMQINSIHFEEFQKKWGIKPSWLVHSNCISIYAGAYVLRREIDRSGEFWRGVGSYNSRTPSLNKQYREKIKTKLSIFQANRIGQIQHLYDTKSMRHDSYKQHTNWR